MAGRWQKLKTVASLAVLALAGFGPAHAAPGDWVETISAIPAPHEAASVALPVANGGGAGAEAWFARSEITRSVYNISQPSLVPYGDSLAGSDNRPAVIVIPGGGFAYLAMDNEGWPIARRLAAQGVRVFILKYRTIPVAGGFAGLKTLLTGIFERGDGREAINRQIPVAVADAQAALRLVRTRVGEWHVDPAKVGVLGFSAGAMTVLGLLQANAVDARPDFAGVIYGPTAADSVPAHAPPLFAAIAADDRFFGNQDFTLLSKWRASGASVEFHLFSGGGHGFASVPNGTTSDLWFDDFAAWLRVTTAALAGH